MTSSKLRAAVLLCALLAGATTAQAHAQLDHASPAVGSSVAASPAQISLVFTQSIEPKFSGASVRNSAGARVDQGSSASGSTLRVSVKGLSPGTYTVSWHVLSVDTHKTQGSFSFRVGR